MKGRTCLFLSIWTSGRGVIARVGVVECGGGTTGDPCDDFDRISGDMRGLGGAESSIGE